MKNDYDNVDTKMNTKEKMRNKTTKLVPIHLRRYLVKPYIVKGKKLAESFQAETNWRKSALMVTTKFCNSNTYIRKDRVYIKWF